MQVHSVNPNDFFTWTRILALQTFTSVTLDYSISPYGQLMFHMISVHLIAVRVYTFIVYYIVQSLTGCSSSTRFAFLALLHFMLKVLSCQL